MSDERIPDGDTPAEVDVWGEQGEADWSKQPFSDARLAPETKRRLRLAVLILSLKDYVVAAPVAFLAGFVLGLGTASRWLIVRRSDYDQRNR